MGIYADERWEPFNNHRSVTYYRETPGLKEILVYELVLKVEEWEDCFCCSCGDRDGPDAACRNHGFAGRRPCDRHQMPGEPWDVEMCDCVSRRVETPSCIQMVLEHDPDKNPACLMGKMPSSVQEKRGY